MECDVESPTDGSETDVLTQDTEGGVDAVVLDIVLGSWLLGMCMRRTISERKVEK